MTAPTAKQPPSILKSLALAVGTLTLSTWALGTLWMQAEAPSAKASGNVNTDATITASLSLEGAASAP